MIRMLVRFLGVAAMMTGCVRSPADVAPPGEGGQITGQTRTKDPFSPAFIDLPGVSINALGTSFHATSDEGGRFRLGRLPLGTYDVLIRSRGTPRLGAQVSGVRLEVEGQSIALGVVRLGEPGVVEGRVTRLDTETPTAGVLVVLVGTDFRGFTDASGAYRIVGVPEGEYTVSALLPGYEPAARTGVRIAANARTSVTELVLRPDPNADVVVVNGVTQALASDDNAVRVRFTQRGGETFETTSSAAGEFQLSVPKGTYRVRFERDGYQPVELVGVVVRQGGVAGLSPVTLIVAQPGDVDGDGIEDSVDPDRDNDGIPNADDLAPDDPTRGADLDNDGTPDEIDDDTDGDGLSDDEELGEGSDGWVTDPLKPDTDDDGVDDADDNCPTVSNAGQDANACVVGAVCDLSPPRLLSVAPSPTRVGESVLVTAQPLAAPSCAPTGATFAELTFVSATGGTVTSTIIATTLRGVVVDGALAQQAEYPVPVTAATGTVTVVQPYAAPSNGRPLVVEPALLQVNEVLPFAGDRGTTVTVVGRGFSVDRAGPLRVRFPGSNDIVIESASDFQFEVVVPADALEGPGQVTVQNDLAQTAFAFTVSSTEPVIVTVDREMVQPGVDDIVVSGANLDGIEAAVFTGGTRQTPTAQSPSSVTFAVPVDALPGPLTLERTDGPDLVYPTPLTIVRNRTLPALGGATRLLVYGFDAVDRLQMVGFGGNFVNFYDPDDLTQLGATMPFPGAVRGGRARPAKDRAVVMVTRLNDLQTYVVNLADGQVVSECDPPFALSTTSNANNFVFGANGRYAYLPYDVSGNRAVLRVDMDATTPAETCTIVPYNRPCGFDFRTAVTAFRDPELLGFGTNQGTAVLRMTFGAAPEMTCPTPPAGDLLQAITPNRIVWDEDNGRIWVADATDLFVFDDDPANGAIQRRLIGAQSDRLINMPGGRWMVAGNLTLRIIDRQRLREVWSGRFRTTPTNIDLHPNGRTIMTFLSEVELLDIETP